MFRGRELWASIVPLQVLLGLLVEEAKNADRREEPWFQALLRHWRVQSAVRDLGATLEDSWTEDQLAVVRQLAERVREALSSGDLPTCVASADWSVSDAGPVAGGSRPEPLVPLLEQVADGFVQLISGALPPDPDGGWWFVGARTRGWSRIGGGWTRRERELDERTRSEG